ncbi:ribonuclease HI [Clostridium swellfunianum]|uniref:ribonuclease HI n=1 Tax=Clostridium swellfunianum TaxID=1367462 RepID=UPI00202F3CD8|nr:ribonuclease HI [Clostridium swellfunianum]MCM0646977.1 ribonuclease HI [Clostridium swellfunianum]
MKNVEIYTDGACRGNGKENTIGAFGIVFIYNGIEKEVKQAFRNTTNNIMELSAVIQALSMLKEPCNVKLYSDSAYVINAINQKWIDNWQRNGWKSSTKEPVKNRELWEKLINLIKYHKVEFIKVKGHSDNPYNNRCDKLANDAMDELLNSNFNV